MKGSKGPLVVLEYPGGKVVDECWEISGTGFGWDFFDYLDADVRGEGADTISARWCTFTHCKEHTGMAKANSIDTLPTTIFTRPQPHWAIMEQNEKPLSVIILTFPQVLMS